MYEVTVMWQKSHGVLNAHFTTLKVSVILLIGVEW